MIDTMITFGFNELVILDENIKKNAVYMIGGKEYSINDVYARCALYCKNNPENMLLLNNFTVGQPRLKRFTDRNFNKVKQKTINYFTTNFCDDNNNGTWTLPSQFSRFDIKSIKTILGISAADEKIKILPSDSTKIIPSFECLLNPFKGKLHL